MLKSLLLIVLFFTAPEPKVQWTGGPESHAVRIRVEGYDQSMLKECLKGGLEVRNRYEIRLCRKRSYWFNSCGPEQREVRAVQYDAISETYRLTADRLGDGIPPKVSSAATLSEALASIFQVAEVPLDFLEPQLSAQTDLAGKYMALRVISECKGRYSETMQRISYFVSLGLVRTSGFDSGWISFDLDR